MTSGRFQLDGDWFSAGVPANILLGAQVYLDSSFGFDRFFGTADPALEVGVATGIYDRASLIVGPRGRVRIGAYTCLNGTTIVANERVEIGSFCLLSWSVFITDSPTGVGSTVEQRRAALVAAGRDRNRILPPLAPTSPVLIEDNVWVGFGSVIGPGVRIGRGAVIGCRSVVRGDVPAYAVVAGDPAVVVRMLDPDDDAQTIEAAIAAVRREPALADEVDGSRAPLTGEVANRRGVSSTPEC